MGWVGKVGGSKKKWAKSLPDPGGLSVKKALLLGPQSKTEVVFSKLFKGKDRTVPKLANSVAQKQ